MGRLPGMVPLVVDALRLPVCPSVLLSVVSLERRVWCQVFLRLPVCLFCPSARPTLFFLRLSVGRHRPEEQSQFRTRRLMRAVRCFRCCSQACRRRKKKEGEQKIERERVRETESCASGPRNKTHTRPRDEQTSSMYRFIYKTARGARDGGTPLGQGVPPPHAPMSAASTRRCIRQH